MPSKQNHIASNLRVLLAVTNTKQKDLAKAIGATGIGTLSAWAKGVSGPSITKVRLICQYFGISIDEFMNEDFGLEIKARLNKNKSGGISTAFDS